MNKKTDYLPSISVITPTLNAAAMLDPCLRFVREQDYPADKIEIIVADGGSTDDTVKVAEKYGAKVYPNPLKTAEAGKAVGLKKAKNELVLLLDSDNFITDKDFLKRLAAPLADKDIIGSEPLYWTYRRTDGLLTRYTTLLGMADPLVLFTGNYDRHSVLSGTWTKMKIEHQDMGDWLKLKLEPHKVPTIGANGTLLRRDFLLSQEIKDYLFDIDIIAEAVDKQPLLFAKIKIGIVHVFSGDLGTFARKQRRRVKDFLFYQKAGVRTYPWNDLNKLGLLKFVLYTVLIVPVFLQSVIGFIKKPDWSWFVHPVACWITLYIYGVERIRASIGGKIEIADRSNWRQTK